MLPKTARSSRSEIQTLVDRFIDQDYLDHVDRAWGMVADYASELVATAGSTAFHPHAQIAMDWLHLAASRRRSASRMELPAGATLSMLQTASKAYPSFLSGESRGTTLLLAGDGLRIWDEYYSSSNSLYAPLNDAAANVLVQRVERAVPFRVLEVGAGSGGASVAALEEIGRSATSPVHYLATDLSARLLRSTADKLVAVRSANIECAFERFDLNTEPTGEKVSAGDFDAILAVNVLHNARDLTATLHTLMSLLRPGGTLIISESICGASQQVHQEFFLNLLPFPEHRHRSASRFLSAAEWRQAIGQLGLEVDIASNSSGPELVLLATVRA